MALQRINRVLIRDVRSWRGEHEFTFDQDLTVLYGPNGSGKSSLWTGIVLGLLYKIRGSVAGKIRSIGGGAGNPYVEIDFIANGVQYRIEKTFADGNASSARLLNLNDGTELSQGDAAVIECRNLLTGSEEQDILGGRTSDVNKALEASTKGQIVDLILPKQGHLNERPKENEALSSVGLEANAESQNYALNSMIAWAEADKKAIETASANLRNALKGTDVEDIKKKTQDLVQSSMKLGEAIYKSQQSAKPGDAPKDKKEEGKKDDNVVDADFEEVKDENKEKSA